MTRSLRRMPANTLPSCAIGISAGSWALMRSTLPAWSTTNTLYSWSVTWNGITISASSLTSVLPWPGLRHFDHMEHLPRFAPALVLDGAVDECVFARHRHHRVDVLAEHRPRHGIDQVPVRVAARQAHRHVEQVAELFPR